MRVSFQSWRNCDAMSTRRSQRPGVRYSSRFLDLVPENTVFYAALPNLSETLAESQRIMQERIKQNPALAEWWKGNTGEGIGLNEQTMTRIQEFGSQLGDEIVVSAEMDAKGEPSGILVLGEVKDAASFRTYLDGQLAGLAKDSGDALNVRIIDDPLTAAVTKTQIDNGGQARKNRGPSPNCSSGSTTTSLRHRRRSKAFAGLRRR